MRSHGRLGRCVGLVVLAGLAGAASAAEPAPERLRAAREAVEQGDTQALLDGVLAYYAELSSYRAEGEVASRTQMFGQESTRSQDFELLLERPDRYRITWSGSTLSGVSAQAPEGQDAGGAVWNAGEGAESLHPGLGTPIHTRERDDRSAFAIAAGVSHGLTRGVPALVLHGAGWLTELQNVALEAPEAVEGEACWVLSGTERDGQKHTLWISQQRLLVRQHRWSLRPSREQVDAVAQMAEQGGLEEALGPEAAADPDAKAKMELIGDLMKVMAKHVDKVEGHSTEIHRNIQVDEPIDAARFRVAVPETARTRTR